MSQEFNISVFPKIPERTFQNLPDYPFKSYYIKVGEVEMHYLDEGKKNSPVIVLLHGEPTWSYLYRKIIPLLVKDGYRVIAPDLIGFGKSDKPTNEKFHTYTKHQELLSKFLFHQLNLTNINLVCHDWGGLISLRIVAEHPEKFSSCVALNTAFPHLEGINYRFLIWRFLSKHVLAIPLSKLIPLGAIKKLSPQELVAYDAPFPNKRYKIAPKRFPSMVPVLPWEVEMKKNVEYWKKLKNFDKPFLVIYSDRDPFTRKFEQYFFKDIPGTKNQTHLKIKNAGHLIQEDEPVLISQAIIKFLKRNGL